MLARYTMYRGPRPAGDPMPEGVRMDTRRHTTHCLRPPRDAVDQYLDDPSPAAWRIFKAAYHAAVERRWSEDRTPFDELAAQARDGDVHLGCSCPTRRNPDVARCHTVLALAFMRKRFPDLDVRMPSR